MTSFSPKRLCLASNDRAHSPSLLTVGSRGSIMAVVRINIPSKGKLPDMWDKIEPHFPMPAPRKYQAEALSVIWWALENDEFDNIVVQAPTGIGKSAIAMAVQSRFDSAYLLTPTLGLTEQYRRDYGSKLKEVQGRRNFPCWARSGTADGAPCYQKKKKCRHAEEDDPCPYYEQKFAAEKARLTLSNPAYMFRVTQSQSAGFEQRKLAVVDEAHNLESFFLGLLEIKITAQDYFFVDGAPRLPPIYDPDPMGWIDEMERVADALPPLIQMAEDAEDESTLDKLRGLLGRVATVLGLLQHSKNVVMETDKTTLTFKPIRISQFAPEYLENVGEKRLLLSATILDIDTYLRNLGLENQKTLYVNITKSPFPSENFNVHYAPCGPMSWGKRAHTIPKQIKAITAIAEHFSEKRGVILPHSHAIRTDIVEGLKAAGLGHRVLTHGSDARGRQLVLDKFMNDRSQSWILVSTYVVEGFDFAGDLAEWLVICKIPYLYTPDPQIAQRMEQDELDFRAKHEGTPACPYEPSTKYSGNLCGSFACAKPCQSWFHLQTALKLVQGMGRIVRRPDDVGHMFILDRGWDQFQRKAGSLLPAWFRSGLSEPPKWLKRHLP